MKVAIMQPYFFPYFGYFQLIAATNNFVVHDDIQYTKKGWLNRNRFLLNGQSRTFTVPVEKSPHTDIIRAKKISSDFSRQGLLNRFYAAYRKAPFFKEIFPVIESILLFNDDSLFEYTLNAIDQICLLLDIDTNRSCSSKFSVGKEFAAEARVIEICKQLGASEYVNPIGGKDLYCREKFENHNIRLQFLETKPFKYKQFDSFFVPNLSIIDALMFNELLRVIDFCKTGFSLKSH